MAVSPSGGTGRAVSPHRVGRSTFTHQVGGDEENFGDRVPNFTDDFDADLETSGKDKPQKRTQNKAYPKGPQSAAIYSVPPKQYFTP